MEEFCTDLPIVVFNKVCLYFDCVSKRSKCCNAPPSSTIDNQFNKKGATPAFSSIIENVCILNI